VLPDYSLWPYWVQQQLKEKMRQELQPALRQELRRCLLELYCRGPQPWMKG
jgi:hypothetical protein